MSLDLIKRVQRCVPTSAFIDAALMLAASNTMFNASASSAALHLASAVFHRTHPLAVYVAPLRCHHVGEICN